MKKNLRYYCMLAGILALQVAKGQAPTISYPNPTNLYEGFNADVVPTVTSGAPVGVSETNVEGVPACYGVALDATGNFYMSANNGTIYKYTKGGSGVAIATGLSSPEGLVVDASGNVLVANSGDGTIREVPAGGGAQFTFASGFSSPSDVTLDASGNIYVANKGAGNVMKIPAGGGNATVFISGFNKPGCIKFDHKGNLFISDVSRLYEVVAGTTSKITAPYYNPGLSINYMA